MEPLPEATAFRIGDFAFEPATGEIRSLRTASGGRQIRLAPQPSRLLEILIEKNGELVTREEIHSSLWPETHVDFDQSLHFCIRQIRSALGDSGTRPTYIETLPRRGYRLMRPAEPLGSREPAVDAGAHGEARGAASRRRTIARALAVLGPALLVVAAGLGLERACRAPAATEPIRLAIMPFEGAATDGAGGDEARISEWLVAELSGGWSGRLEVVGPRTTAAYSAVPFPRLDRLSDDLAIDFVLNARTFDRDGERGLLVELIRLDDGAHLWAEFFAGPRSWLDIAQEVRSRAVGALGLPSEAEAAR